jgi:Fur family iron response transcriptional regulator
LLSDFYSHSGFEGDLMPDFEDMAIARLRKAGLRPTRQRRDLARLLFAECNEAVTAESLHAFALKHGVKVSLATVYGTLHCFCDAGLVREVAIDSRRYFDTNPENRQYFYFEDERRLVGVSEAETGFKEMPPPPAGRKVSRVDVVVRLRRD